MTHQPPEPPRPWYKEDPPPAGPATTSRLAVASLVCGIASFVCILGPLAGIPAVITGHMALQQIRRSGGTVGGRGLALAGVILGWVVVGITVLVFVISILLAILMPAVHTAQGRAQAAVCMNNLQQLHLACAGYAAENDGRMPDRLSQLYPDYIGGLDVFVCPGTGDAIGSEEEIEAGTSYVYLAAGKRMAEIGPDDVIARDKPGNHPGDGIVHVLYGDGRVVEEPSQVQELGDELEKLSLDEARELGEWLEERASRPETEGPSDR